jgi:hypothetical protein
MLRPWLRGVASAPLAAVLGIASIGLTATIVLRLGAGGRLSTISALGLGVAAVLAVLATAQASRPSLTEPQSHPRTVADSHPPKPKA